MSFNIARIIPNTLTCCNLISGAIATFNAFYGDYIMALSFIIIGAIFDFFDGFSARLLHVSSPIGKELDSLADVVTFGLAPSAIVFIFLDQFAISQTTWGRLIPYTAFLIAAFSALRLAKFNLDTRQATSFIGLPTPANALFWGSFILGGYSWLTQFEYTLYLLLALILISCWLLVSEIPMFALKFKTFAPKENVTRYVFLLFAILLLGWLQVQGIAAVIVWYIVLSLFTQKKQ